MSINWKWTEKCGEAVIEQTVKGETNEHTLSLYEGNAWLVMLSEWKDENGNDMWNMYTFFADKEHAKICLGLKKNSDGKLDNILNHHGTVWKKLRLDKAKCRNYKEIVNLFVQAFDNLTIEIYKGDAT